MIFDLNEIQPIPWLSSLLSTHIKIPKHNKCSLYIRYLQISSVYIYSHHTPTQSPYYREVSLPKETSQTFTPTHVLDCVPFLLVFFRFNARLPEPTVKCIPVTPRNDPLTSQGHWTTPTSFHGLAKHRPFGHHFWGGSKCESVFGGKNGKTSVIWV